MKKRASESFSYGNGFIWESIPKNELFLDLDRLDSLKLRHAGVQFATLFV